MGIAYVLNENELRENPGLHEIKILESREDVATLLDIYESIIESGISQSQIVGVRGDNRKNYYFIVSDRKLMFSFDIVAYVASRFSSRKVTNANIKLMFPLSLSRRNDYKVKDGSSSYGVGLPKLYYEKEGLLVTIPRDGEVVIGRSEKKTNFQIKGNPDVSRVHCKVYYDRRTGSTCIEDCNSNNGTFINGDNIGNKQAKLKVGDVVSLANEKLLVVKG